MTNQSSRHDQLIAAGWRYDATSDMYEAPGSPIDGSARRFNLGAAWLAFSTDTAPLPAKADTPPSGTRAADPRHKEPE